MLCSWGLFYWRSLFARIVSLHSLYNDPGVVDSAISSKALTASIYADTVASRGCDCSTCSYLGSAQSGHLRYYSSKPPWQNLERCSSRSIRASVIQSTAPLGRPPTNISVPATGWPSRLGGWRRRQGITRPPVELCGVLPARIPHENIGQGSIRNVKLLQVWREHLSVKASNNSQH